MNAEHWHATVIKAVGVSYQVCDFTLRIKQLNARAAYRHFQPRLTRRVGNYTTIEFPLITVEDPLFSNQRLKR
jgi:hypothetical protein